MNDDEAKSIQRDILNYLARRDHSLLEIRRKLKQKGYQADDVEKVLDDLIVSGTIDDRRFAENYIYWHKNKGLGPQRITMDLLRRGVAQEIIEEFVQPSDYSWCDEIQMLWQKKFKGQIPKSFVEKAKQIRYFQQRGFTRDQIETLYRLEGEETSS